jgi:hypothetical protein
VRIEEPATGAATSVLVALAVLPTRADKTITDTVRKYLDMLRGIINKSVRAGRPAAQARKAPNR